MISRTLQRLLIVVSLLSLSSPAFAAKAVVTGSATYRERVALTPGAVFEATLEEVSRADAPARVIKRVRMRNPGQVPIHFEIPYNPRRIDARRDYILRASIYEDGQLRFATTRATPVLTHGHGSRVRVLMRRTSGGGAGTEMSGMFRYTADAPRFRDCSSGRMVPVAMSDDYRALERAYTRQRPSPGAELMVSIRGRIEQRPRMEGSGTEPMLVVERFLRAMPGERCGGGSRESGLTNTRWRPVRIGNFEVVVQERQREPWIELDSRSNHLTGSGGCNRFTGSYEAGNGTLRFGRIARTMMACIEMDTENAFLRALERTRQYRVRGRILDLIDDRGQTLARLEERNLR